MTQGPAADGPVVAVVATEDTAARWTEAFVTAGLAAVAVPFATVVPPPDPDALAAVLLTPYDLCFATSANAVRYLPPGAVRGHGALAVGARTAEALARVGYRVLATGERGAEALARILVDVARPCRVVWLRGVRANDAGVEVLLDAGFSVAEVVAYGTADAPGFAAAVAGLASRRVVWVLGSGAAAEAWLRVVRRSAAARGPCVAAGATAAAPLRAAAITDVTVATDPTPEALVAAVRAALAAPPG